MGITIFLAVLGSISLMTGISFYRKISRIASWPQVNAILTKRGVKDTDKAVSASPGFRKEMDVEFEYTFENKVYKANTYAVATEVTSEEIIQRKLDKLPDKFQVYVNPEKPEEAYIKVNSKLLAITAFLVGVICLLALVVRLL